MHVRAAFPDQPKSFAQDVFQGTFDVESAAWAIAKLTDTVFPDGDFAPSIPDPSPEEAEQMRKDLERRVYNRVPGKTKLIERQLWLIPADQSYCQIHLVRNKSKRAAKDNSERARRVLGFDCKRQFAAKSCRGDPESSRAATVRQRPSASHVKQPRTRCILIIL